MRPFFFLLNAIAATIAYFAGGLPPAACAAVAIVFVIESVIARRERGAWL